MGKTPSSHIIHSLGGEYCWIVRDSEPIRLLNSPRSPSVYKLLLFIPLMAIISDIFVDSKLWALDMGILRTGALDAIWGSQNNIFEDYQHWPLKVWSSFHVISKIKNMKCEVFWTWLINTIYHLRIRGRGREEWCLKERGGLIIFFHWKGKGGRTRKSLPPPPRFKWDLP